MSWSYNPACATPKDQVRLFIGDTDTTDQQLQDEEICFLLAARPDSTMAAADACRQLAGKYSRQADFSNLSLRVAASQRSKAYLELAYELEQRALRVSGATLTVTGTSIADKLTHETNADEVQPNFRIGNDDEPGANPQGLPPYLDPYLNGGQ